MSCAWVAHSDPWVSAWLFQNSSHWTCRPSPSAVAPTSSPRVIPIYTQNDGIDHGGRECGVFGSVGSVYMQCYLAVIAFFLPPRSRCCGPSHAPTG